MGPASASSRSVTLTWQGGTGQTGYMLVRLGLINQGVNVTSLPATATTSTDTSPPTQAEEPLPCYVLLVMNGSNVVAASDALCALIGLMSPSDSPTNFALSLNQGNTASLRWGAPGGQSGYTLYAIPLSAGGQIAQIPLGAGATSATHNTGGTLTCYLLAALNSSGATAGLTDMLCGLPGIASFPPATSAQQAIISIKAAASTQSVDASAVDTARQTASHRGKPRATPTRRPGRP